MIVEIGASQAIPTIRNMGDQLLYSNKDSMLIRINPEAENTAETSSREVYLQGGAL